MFFLLSYDVTMHIQSKKKPIKNPKKQPTIITNQCKKLPNCNKSLQAQENQRVSELMD